MTRIYNYGAPFERWLAHVVARPDGCWEWAGARSHGYGNFNAGHGNVRAHRFGYENLIGAIPDGLEPDHLCRRRWCVNSTHLDIVTHRINVVRGPSLAMQAHRAGKCTRGHAASESLRRKSTGAVVYCRACRRERRSAA